MSMAHSIEAREPLLDQKIVEFSATIPPELMMKGGTTKYIFKRAMQAILPTDIIKRPKRGFAVPLNRWFRGRMGPFLRDLLLSRRSIERGIFRKSYIERLIDLNDRGRSLDLALWTLITFELWCRRFIDESPVCGAISTSSRRCVGASTERVHTYEERGSALQGT
jgi:asparagine synthase (glutamine-hydrolysing)